MVLGAAGHDVQAREGASVTLDHPQVGELTLNREKLAIGGSAGQLLVVYHPDCGTDNAENLSLLASCQVDLPVPAPTGRATATSD